MSVAETVCPSVRGAEGVRVVAVLTASGVLTGGLVGLVAGVAWAAAGLGPATPGMAGAVALACVVGDVAARRWPSVRPLASRRQVPQAWGRLFGIRLAALLYGARLGVGPLTILTSWAWWGALVVGASLGPWPSAAVGVAFAVVRTVVTVIAGAGVTTGEAMHRRMARIGGAEAPVAWVGAVVVVLGVAAGAGW